MDPKQVYSDKNFSVGALKNNLASSFRPSINGGATASNGILSPKSMVPWQSVSTVAPRNGGASGSWSSSAPTTSPAQSTQKYGSKQLGYYDTWDETLAAIQRQNTPKSVDIKIDDNIPSEALNTAPSGTTLSETRKGNEQAVLNKRFADEEEQLLASIANMNSGIADLSATQAREFYDLEKNKEGVYGQGVLGSQLSRLSRDQAIELNARTGQLQAQLDTLKMYQGYTPDIVGTPQIDETTGEAFVYMQDPTTGQISTQSLGQIMTPQVSDPFENTQVLSEGQTLLGADGKPIYSAPKTYAPSSSGGTNLPSGMAGVSGDLARLINIQSSYIPSENQRNAYINAAQGYLESGDYEGLKYYMRNQGVNNLPATEQTGYRKNIEILKGLEKVDSILAEIEAKGVDTNILRGSWQKIQEKVGALGDPQLVALAYQAQQAMDLITRQRTGAALNKSEEAFYKKMVPGVFKGVELNKELVNQFKNSLESNTDSYLGVYFSPKEIDTLNTAAGGGSKPSLDELLAKLQ